VSNNRFNFFHDQLSDRDAAGLDDCGGCCGTEH
jgi:hypothetical protein